MGGHRGISFTLKYRLELTQEEADLVKKYNLHDYALTYTNFNEGEVPDDTIRRMCEGRTQTLPDVTTLIKNEEIIKNSCDSLPILFAMCRTFGGDEVIEYPRKNLGHDVE
jgi:hypothetical protein